MSICTDLDYIIDALPRVDKVVTSRAPSGAQRSRATPDSRPPLNLDAFAAIVGSNRAPAMYSTWPDPQDYPPEVAGFGRSLLWWLPSCCDWAQAASGTVAYPEDLTEPELEDPSPRTAARIMRANADVIHDAAQLLDADAVQAWEDHMRIIASELRRLLGENDRLRCPGSEGAPRCGHRIVQDGDGWICPVHGVLRPQTGTLTQIARKLHVPLSTAHHWPERGLLSPVGKTKRGKPLYYFTDARRILDKRKER